MACILTFVISNLKAPVHHSDALHPFATMARAQPLPVSVCNKGFTASSVIRQRQSITSLIDPQYLSRMTEVMCVTTFCAIIATLFVTVSASDITVVLPAAGDSSLSPNLTYALFAAHGTTGRVATIGNPRHGFNVFCAGCDTRKQCIGVLETVDVQATIHGCMYATNGGPFAEGNCLTPIISNGTLMSSLPQPNGVQCLGMLRNGSWILGWIPTTSYPNIVNMMCGFDWLLRDGEPMWSHDKEIAPRTAFGIDKAGRLITLVAEGSEVAYTGLTLNQTSVWIKELGAVWAINMDGGGSSTSWLASNGGVQGCPTCIDEPYCCSRSVSTILCVPHGA